uniref:[histone H3]-dimethyl-L-lysine(9) demethylase n=1 Tax=Culex tarsalis TaxID=7177 RepID=A0A1Q3FWM2_CULTA
MSSSSKDHAYELMLGLGQDLQKQIMKIAQSSPQEPPATAIPKPVTMEKKPPPPSSTGPPVPAPVRPQQFEKKTFEQAYREAVERLNSESINKPGMKNIFSRTSNNASNQSHKQPAEVPKPAASSVAASQPSNSIVTSSPHYKTTIYNINTINLASLLKTQRSSQPDSTTGANSSLHALLSPSSSARVMAESSKYRQTYSNAYANHLLELTRNAVEKKSGRANDYTPIGNTTQQKSNAMLPAAAQQKKLPKPQLPGLFVMNGKEGSSSFVDKSKGTNGTAVPKRNSPSKSTKNEIVFTTPSNVTVVAPLSKPASITPPAMPRLKPSSVQTNRDDTRQGSAITQTYLGHQHLSSPGSAAKTPTSSASLPIPGLGNRPDLTVIVNKPKITSPAPAHVYGKPTISTTSITPTRTSVANTSGSQNYTVGFYTPKREASSYRDPPPAHSVGTKSSYPVSVIAKPPILSDSGRAPTHEKTTCPSKPASIIVKASDLTRSVDLDGVLNLDIKTTTSSTASSCGTSIGDVKPKPPTVPREHGLLPSTSFHTTSSERNTSLYNSQKVAKIEKRVNYDVSANKPISSNDSAPKYQQNAVWKEQPPVKTEGQPKSSGAIDEQKQKLLELLHNANFQQLYSKAQAHANDAKSVGTENIVVSSLTKHMSHINRINMELYKYRKSLSSNSGVHARPQPVDPLAFKRKDPPIRRTDAPRRKRPKPARSTESYLQNGPCYDVAPRLPRCRECGRSAAARSRDAANIFCRFIAFRKLRYNDSGFMEVVGFAEPNLDPQSSDTELWNANLQKVPIDISVEKGKFLLGQVGYKFCELFHQEKEAYFEHMSEDKTIAWKQSVQGVREMCDVCSTTLFNYHWVCSTCGFVVCIDCYKGRKHGARKNDTGTKDRDGYTWLHCTTNKEPHAQEKLMLTQIIPSNSLYKLVRQMHGICALLEIPLNCECPLSKESLFRKIKDRLEFIYPLMVESKGGEESAVSSSGSTTKMISISIKSIESKLSETESGTICCKVIFGRELSGEKNPEAEIMKRRIKQSYSFEGFQEDIRKESLEDFIKASPQYKPTPEDNAKEVKNDENVVEMPTAVKSENEPKNQPVDDESSRDEEPYSEEHRFKPSPKLDWKTFNMIVKQLLKFDKSINISGLFEQHLTEKCPESESLVDFTAEIQVNHSNLQSFLSDFLDEFVFLKGQNKSDNLTDDVQVYNSYLKKSIEFQNKGERVMDLKESEKLYPNVAHQWLCNGRLLRLLDPLNDNNYTTFHDQWERGQPVMVSYVSGAMDMNLWHPESFIRDFGEEENDLINCLNGKLVRGQQMKVFWEGFERIGFRLLDERDRPMILKLKDWPPGDDFAEMMPTRFNDLMKCLPLAEYTRREGRLNLASRLSSFFVRPDLGPKMYSAYGSALHPTKGTTNLHLDVSDAVNVMVYVGVPKDADQKKYTAKVLDSIDTDELDSCTRQRIREKGELPGALWHIYHAKDADKIRDLLNKIEVERGGSIKANHDPIHDQKWYLDANLRRRLLQDYNVEGYAILQCSGDAIFIPAGAPHQVRNLHNCIKVAEDFVSPENISYCFKLTNEFRHLTNTHSNHEDKLQIKNIIYHTVKDAVSCLTNPLILTKGDKIDLL